MCLFQIHWYQALKLKRQRDRRCSRGAENMRTSRCLQRIKSARRSDASTSNLRGSLFTGKFGVKLCFCHNRQIRNVSENKNKYPVTISVYGFHLTGIERNSDDCCSSLLRTPVSLVRYCHAVTKRSNFQQHLFPLSVATAFVARDAHVCLKIFSECSGISSSDNFPVHTSTS